MGASVEAAQSVCDLDDELDVELDAASLANKSLLRFEFDADEQPRLVMLQSLREFALEKLSELAEFEQLKVRHAQWFLRLAERSSLRGADNDVWLDRLYNDLANLREVMQDLIARADPAALGLGARIWFVFYQRGLLSEGRGRLQELVETFASHESLDRAECLLGLATLARQQNDVDVALQHALQALTLYRVLDDAHGIAAAQSALGSIYQRKGATAEAEEALTDALQRLRALDAPDKLSFTLTALGALHHAAGDLDAARPLYEEALGIGRERRDKNTIATALVNLGELFGQLGDVAHARALYTESLSMYAELGLLNAIAYNLEVLAGLLAETHAAQAAGFMGAAHRLRVMINTPIESFNEQRLRQDEQTLRTALGEQDYQRLWEQGAAVPMADTVRQAVTLLSEE